VGVFGLLLLLATCAGAVAVVEVGTFDAFLFATLLVIVVGADLMAISFKSLSISGSFVGIVLAMGLLGPTWAALLGLLSNVVWFLRDGPRPAMAVLTTASIALASLVGGLVLHVVAGALAIGPGNLAYTGPLLVAFAATHVVNFSLVFAGHRVVDGTPFWSRVRTVILPLLPSEAAMVLLLGLIIFAEQQTGPMALAMLAALFGLYLYLYRELALSQERGEELERRNDQLASLQVGVLTAMLRTLSLRDRMTARHSAAVARYARAMAAAHGCTAEEQDLVHTAGLLHDIGKFILPDHILVADTRPSEDDWQLIKMHPYQGARVVQEVEGYGPVADIILAHHERIDGRGYPRGIAGDAIPLFSRMISIADTYDVMTSRDSYRDPVTSAEAIEELRRVSGAQLDGDLVELFVGLLESEDVAFRHGDDADFEAELAFDRRVRDHAAPRPEPLPVAA
jgi:putative nucleotidyltransferase with HDIG domain